MEIYTKIFKRNFFKFSLIGLIFILSCGREAGVQEDDETVEWYTKLGFKDNMKKMKEDTQLLTRRLGEGDWAEAESLCVRINKSFNELNLDSSEIPEDFFELRQKFSDSLEKLLQTCRDKDGDKIAARLDVFKKSCSYCHRIIRKELDRMNMEFDFDVALERVYRDRKPDGN